MRSSPFEYPPDLPGSVRHEYSRPEVGLGLWVYRADTPAPAPAVVLFFGGGWVAGSPSQFAPHARYLASRGVTSILVDYRVTSRNASTVRNSLADATSAFAWVRSNARSLGIDPRRIAAGGGSAGGHLAAMLASLPDAADRPDALLLFNPVLVLAREGSERSDLNPQNVVATMREWGVDPEEFSPYHRLDRSLPPALIQHGRSDSVVPFAASEAYVHKALYLGAPVIHLVGYDEQEHGFFNVGRSGGWPFLATLRRADEFLACLGWVDGEPSLTNGAPVP